MAEAEKQNLIKDPKSAALAIEGGGRKIQQPQQQPLGLSVNTSIPKVLSPPERAIFDTRKDLISSFSQSVLNIQNVDMMQIMNGNMLAARVNNQYFAVREMMEAQEAAKETRERVAIAADRERIEEDKTETKEIRIDDGQLVKSAIEYETVLAMVDDVVQTLITSIEVHGSNVDVRTRVATQRIDPALKIEKEVVRLAEGKERLKDSEVLERLSNIDAILEKSEPRIRDISDAIKRIKVDASEAARQGKKIATIAEVEGLPKAAAEEIRDRSLKEPVSETKERMRKGAEAIKEMAKNIQTAVKEARALLKEIPKDFYEEKLEKLLENLPNAVKEMIRSRSKDPTVTGGELASDLQKIAEWVESDKFKRRFAEISDKPDATQESINTGMERLLKELDRFMDAREKLVKAIGKNDADGILEALGKMKEAAPTTEAKETISKAEIQFKETIDDIGKIYLYSSLMKVYTCGVQLTVGRRAAAI